MANIITLRFNIDGVAVLANTYPNTSLQITKKVTDIESLNGQGTITEETFRVPLIDKLIQHLGDLTDISQEPKVNVNNSINGQVLINNFPIYDGSFNIISAYKNTKNNIKEIEFIFKGNETNIKSILTKITLADLLKDETLPYTYAEISSYMVNSASYIETNGYAFPLIDFGQKFTQDTTATEGKILSPTNTANPLTQRDFKPAVWVKYLFDKMPLEITVDESMEDLLDQVIPLHNNNEQMPVLDTTINRFVSNMNQTTDVTMLEGLPNRRMPFDAKVVTNEDIIDLPNREFDIPYSGFYTFRISGTIEVTGNSVPPGFFRANTRILLILTTGTIVDGAEFYRNPLPAETQTLLFNYERTLFLQANSILALDYRVEEVLGTSTSILKSGYKIELLRSPAISPTSNVLIDKNCPNLTAWDIFRTIATQANAIITINVNGEVNLMPWIKWIDNNEIVNLNDSIDEGTDVRIEPFSIKGAKRIRLKYQDDEDLLNKKFLELVGQTYGTLLIEDTGTDFATNELTIELPFAATPQQNPTNGFFPIPKFYNENFELIKTKPRLLPFNRTPTTSQEFIDVGSPLFVNDFNSSESTRLGLLLSFNHWAKPLGGYNTNDYNFGQSLTFFASSNYPNNTLYERFWRKYIEQTYSKDARLIEMGVKLNKTAAINYRLNEKFFYQNSMFRVTGINNLSLISDEPVKITMLKRFEIENIDKAPFYPFDVVETIVQWKDSLTDEDLGDASAEPEADVEESTNAYGFFYDSGNNLAIQQGQILQF